MIAVFVVPTDLLSTPTPRIIWRISPSMSPLIFFMDACFMLHLAIWTIISVSRRPRTLPTVRFLIFYFGIYSSPELWEFELALTRILSRIDLPINFMMFAICRAIYGSFWLEGAAPFCLKYCVDLSVSTYSSILWSCPKWFFFVKFGDDLISDFAETSGDFELKSGIGVALLDSSR